MRLNGYFFLLQALAIITLAFADEKQHFDNYAGGEDEKRFILHYNFPPFSVGECGRTGGINRREIGHGSLAERSIEPVIPDEPVRRQLKVPRDDN